MSTTENGIYYPNDYETVADIPADMEKLAESVDTKVSENKTKIEEIKIEQTTQNTNIQNNTESIEELQKENIKLKSESTLLKSQIPQGQASGENITLKDSSNMPFEEFRIKGNSIQNETPTTEIPVEIKNVTSVNVRICNKNLTDYKDWIKITPIGSLEISENLLTYNLTNNCYGLKDIERTLKPNTAYTAYCDYTFTGTLGSQWGLRVKKNETWEALTKNNIINFVTDETGIIQLAFYIATPYTGDDAVLTLKNIRLYEVAKSQTFSFPLVEGQKLYKESYLADDGIHHKRSQVTLDGTEAFIEQTQIKNNIFYTALKVENMKDLSNLKSSHFENILNPSSNLGIGATYKNYIYFGIGIETISALETETITQKTEKFKIWLANQKNAGTPVTIEYELEEEIIEPYTTEQQAAYNQIKQASSYKNTTNIFSTDEVRPIIEVTYIKDLETLFNNLLATSVAEGG